MSGGQETARPARILTGMKRRMLLLVVALAGVAATLTVPASAAPRVLTLSNELITWKGTAKGGELNPFLVVNPVPTLRCLQGACRDFAFSVKLGKLFWSNQNGAVEVAIRWAYDGIVDLDLQVLDAAGKVVAQSIGVDSNAEIAFVPNARDGLYFARVIPSNTFVPGGTGADIPFEALVQVERSVIDKTQPRRDLLPNLKPLPPDGFHVATALNLIPFPENPLLSCYPEETIQRHEHPTRCLRFNQTIANVGEGPLVLRFDLKGVVSPRRQDRPIFQRILGSDGVFRDRFADSYVLHLVHAHLHYQGFGQSFLYRYDLANDRRSGNGIPAKVGNKVGFCVIDVLFLDHYWTKTGNGPRGHFFPYACIQPEEIDLSKPAVYVEQGFDVGWADVYGWNLADQYIDITNLPDGVYELLQVANPKGSVREVTRADNCASTIVRMTGDVVKIIRSNPDVACP